MKRSYLMEASRAAAAQSIRVAQAFARRAAGRLMVGTLVCVASVMCATPARAQLPSTSAPQVSRSQDNEKDFPFGDNDPCIASVVAGQGHFHSQFIDRSTATTSDTTFRIHQNGQGANTVPGDTARYQFEYWSEQRFQSSTTNFTFTTQLRKHIIREGPLPAGLTKDDYFAQEDVTFSPVSPMPSINSFKNEATCK